MQIHLIKNNGIAGLEMQVSWGLPCARFIDFQFAHGPFKCCYVGSGGHAVIEASWNHVHGRCINSAIGQGNPEVHRANTLAEESTVLMPAIFGIKVTRNFSK